MRTGEKLKVFEEHLGAVNCVAVSPSGRRFATASEDTTAILWQPGQAHAQRARRWHERLPAAESAAAARQLASLIESPDLNGWLQAREQILQLGDRAVDALLQRHPPGDSLGAARAVMVLIDLLPSPRAREALSAYAQGPDTAVSVRLARAALKE